MSTRYNNGSHYENHQRARELQQGAEHAHNAAEHTDKQEHLTPHEQTRLDEERDHEAHPDGHARFEFGHNDIAALAHELWHERGCPEGSADEDWFNAVKQLRTRALVH